MKKFFGVFFVAVFAASGLFLSCSDDCGSSLFVAPSNTTTTNTTTSTTSTRYYKVTFLSNGGSKIFPQGVESGKTAIRPNDPTRECYVFDGWYYSDQLFDFSTPVTSDITLIAKWKVVYHTISYESEYGTAPSSIKVLENTVLTSEELPAILCENKVFRGWFNGDGKIREGDVVKNDLILVAKWSDYVTITYESKFGNVPNSLDIRLNSALTGADLPDVSCKPYTFLGWFYSCDEFGNGTGLAVQVGDVLTVDVTLYAKWVCGSNSLFMAIIEMTKSSPIHVVGALSSAWLKEDVNVALKMLAEKNKGVLVSLDLSEVTGLTTLPSKSFRSCENLAKIVLPDSVTSIGYEAFSGCTGLTSYNYAGTLKQWCSISFEDVGSNPCYYAKKLCIQGQEIKDLVIPDGVTSIGSSAFSRCAGLTSVTIPSGVTSIGSSAFSGCIGLTSVTIPGSVTSIGSSAFSVCTGLASVTIPSSVTSIGQYAFDGCKSLANAFFSDTSGWCYTNSSGLTGGAAISSARLVDSTTAAMYLRDTYCGYYWYKKN